ncbi:hypothetical protein [Variovorax saccharolyticus]|uniref:hypothetical protein n=1 Tax=Variovorax saccharolyticus TaxID=3053516 RepID=UPI002575D865|nr:hypothetical protein [Variovorax sp. J31P216]MDM0029654.1 hypothetical protein [Variovorax sp. J31P216]
MSSKSLAVVALASLCFAGCTVQPRAAAPVPAAPVAVAPPPAPAQTPAAQPATKPDAKKNARQKASSGSAAADATSYLTYEDIKRDIRKEIAGSGYTDEMWAGKAARLNAKNLNKEGYFYLVKRDDIFFTCRSRAPGFKAGMITGTLLGTEFWDDGSKVKIVSLEKCAAA